MILQDLTVIIKVQLQDPVPNQIVNVNILRWYPILDQPRDKTSLYGKRFFAKDEADNGLCCRGVFVEFGARDGIQDSNTLVFERSLKWKGLLFEMNPKGENIVDKKQ
jgi:hypothetical protein